MRDFWGAQMTIQELYLEIGGDYDQAIRVLRMDKLVDKHIRKLTGNGVVTELIDEGNRMDAAELFEKAHAAKGVCANLGLMTLSGMASDIAEEFRPGNARTMTDAQVRAKIIEIEAQYKKTVDGIKKYVEG